MTNEEARREIGWLLTDIERLRADVRMSEYKIKPGHDAVIPNTDVDDALEIVEHIERNLGGETEDEADEQHQIGFKAGESGKPYVSTQDGIGGYFNGWVEGRARWLKLQPKPKAPPSDGLAESTKKTAEWLNAHGSRAELKRWGANHPQRDLLRAYIVQLRKNGTRRTILGGPHG